MKQGLRWVLWSVCGLLLAATALWTASRLWGVTDAQRAALAQMRAEWTPAGRNGFAALWTLRRDVPADRQQAVLDADVRTIQAWPPQVVVERKFRSAADDYPDLAPAPDESPTWCGRDAGCLAKVAADVPAYSALVERHARLIARADALLGYDYLKSPLPPRIDGVTPVFADTIAPATRDALLFAQGHRQEALANVCRAIGAWRRYAANSDQLIATMVADANSVEAYGSLFAEMLAALPADAAVPAECDAALAQVQSQELSLCTAMKGEFAYGEAAIRQMMEANADKRRGIRLAEPLLYDDHGTQAMRASVFAETCDRRVAGMIERDVPASLQADAGEWWERFGCIGNMLGCMVNGIAGPAYEGYLHRRQDSGMKLRLLGTLLWLHRNPQPDASLAERLARRPAALKSPAREIRADADGKRLRIDLYAGSKASDWSQPLAR